MRSTDSEPIYPSVLFKMLQMLVIAEAALEIQEQETNDEPRLAEAMAKYFQIHVENFPPAKLPVGYNKESLKYVSDQTVYTGISLWRKWKAMRKEVLGQYMPIWHKMEPFASGTQVEDVLKQVREELWNKKEKTRLHDRAVRDKKKLKTAPAGSVPKPTGGSSVALPMPESWFPTEYMILVNYGPPAVYFEGKTQADVFKVNVTEESDDENTVPNTNGDSSSGSGGCSCRKSRKRQRDKANDQCQYETRNDLLRRLVNDDAATKARNHVNVAIDARAQQFAELQLT